MQDVVHVFEQLLSPNNWFGVSFYAAIFFGMAMVCSRLIRLAVQRVIMRHESALVDPTVVMFLSQFAQIGVYIVGLIIFFHIIPALNRLGTALLTGVSVVSVVFGLAAQNTLSNLVAGCTLLLYRPFHINDLIQVATPTGTESGIVERLTLGYAMLRTRDDRLVIIPNSLMASQVSLNLNRRSLRVMAIISVGVTDTSKLNDVRNTLNETVQADKRIIKVINYVVQMLEEGGAILSVRTWCANAAVAENVQREIPEALVRKFGDQIFYLDEVKEVKKLAA